MTSFRFGVYVVNYFKFEEPIASENLKDPFLRSEHGLINYIDTKAKCRHLKNFTL